MPKSHSDPGEPSLADHLATLSAQVYRLRRDIAELKKDVRHLFGEELKQ